MSKHALEAIRTQVMWNRLIAVVEEQAQSLLRTAFGTITREAGDLSAGVYNTQGHMIAQAMTGTPGHVNTMATAVRHFFKHYPQHTMKPGDVYVTNDPWEGTGHLFDYVMMTPVFLGKKLVAFFASTCHLIDVGGIGFSAKGNSSYEEGMYVPHMMLRKQGVLNDDLLKVILGNTRNPVEVKGDLLSLVSANDTGVRRLIEMMTEFKLTSLDKLAYLTQSEKGARDAIKTLPEGEWSYAMPLDGYEKPVLIKAKLKIKGGKVTVDYRGTSSVSIFGINSPRTYTEAYTVFALKAIIAPHVPNNIGSLSCFDIETEPHTIVDPIRPSPVTSRHVTGQMLADAGLRLPVPGPARPGAGRKRRLHLDADVQFRAWPRCAGAAERCGGICRARHRPWRHRWPPGKDGLACVAFPSGIGGIPIEIIEGQCPLWFEEKQFLPNSAAMANGAAGFRSASW